MSKIKFSALDNVKMTSQKPKC